MALLEACRLAHDDDAPRLVWADDVGGERGELVVVQCDLARGKLTDERCARERELLAAHGTEWAGALARHATRWEFRRGFLEAAAIDAATFIQKADAIFAAAPLFASLTATGLDDEDDALSRLHALVASPAFWRLAGLDLVDPEIGDDAAEHLLASAALESLRALGLAGLTADGAHRLVTSRELGGLEKLKLAQHRLADDAIIALLRSAPQLAALDLTGVRGDGVAIVRALPQLRELRIGPLAVRDLDALARSPAAATLHRLVLVGGARPLRTELQLPALHELLHTAADADAPLL